MANEPAPLPPINVMLDNFRREQNLRIWGNENGPPPSPPPLPRPEPEVPPVARRQWPWYALQISIFAALLALDIEYGWFPSGNAYLGTFVMLGSALLITWLCSLFLDGIARLARR